MIIKRGKKTNFKPYISNGKSCVISWGYKDLQENGFGEWCTEQFREIPDFTIIKQKIVDWYNQEINKEIFSGFKWKGYQVWLSTENQFNYKAIYDLSIQSNGKNLPVTLKFESNGEPCYYTFNTIDELEDFYMSVIQFIQNTLQKGWEKKDNIEWKNYQK